MMNLMNRLTTFAIVLAAVVVILGAYTRLTDAGLGCPDWPGCYGFATVPTAQADIATAEQAFPERPVEVEKAWNEMIHRYFAGTLGLVILALFVLALRSPTSNVLPSILLATVTFQALLGMWTVTMNLMPLVVLAHLLGGFTTFCLLILLKLKLNKQMQTQQLQGETKSDSRPIYQLAKVTFVVLVLQIALGGWTASNYAAVACTQLPICEGEWSSRLDFAGAFSIPTGHDDYEFGVFPYESRMTIHVMHRFGAVITLLAFAWLAIKLIKQRSQQLKLFGGAVLTLLMVQFLLGVSNVVFQLPLAVAVAHNFVALCLLACNLALLFFLKQQSQQQLSFNTWVKG